MATRKANGTTGMTDDDFVALWHRFGSAAAISRHVGIAVSNVHARRRSIEGRRKIKLVAGDVRGKAYETPDGNAGELQARIKELELALKTNQRDQLDEEYVKSKILKLAEAPAEPPAWLLKPTSKPNAPGVPTVFWSDWHHGEVVDATQIGGVNSYDITIAHRRIQRLVGNTIDLLKRHMVNPDYPGIVVALGGDMISGDIHEELTATNEKEVMPVVLDLFGVLIWALTTLADEFGQVFVPCVSGNHGRDTQKIRAKGRNFTSFDWLLYCFLAKHFERDNRVRFLIPNGPDALYSVYGHRYLLTHGDQFRGGDGMIGALGPIIRGDHKKRSRNAQIDMSYDTMLLGHWHQLIQLKRLIVNGSLKGYDEYAYSGSFGFEPPQQALWITHPTRGITFSMPVHVAGDDGPAKPKQTWVSWAQ